MKTVPKLPGVVRVRFASDDEPTQAELDQIAAALQGFSGFPVRVDFRQPAEGTFLSNLWAWIHDEDKVGDLCKDAVDYVKDYCRSKAAFSRLHDSPGAFFEDLSDYIGDVQDDHMDCPDLCRAAHDLDEIRGRVADDMNLDY